MVRSSAAMAGQNSSCSAVSASAVLIRSMPAGLSGSPYPRRLAGRGRDRERAGLAEIDAVAVACREPGAGAAVGTAPRPRALGGQLRHAVFAKDHRNGLDPDRADLGRRRGRGGEREAGGGSLDRRRFGVGGRATTGLDAGSTRSIAALATKPKPIAPLTQPSEIRPTRANFIVSPTLPLEQSAGSE